MKLYVTFTSPYLRLARILVLEKALENRVEIIAAKTRVADSPYYQSIHLGVYRTLLMIQALAWRTANSSAPILTAWTVSLVSTTAPAKRIGLTSGLSSRRAICAKASAYGYARWRDPRASVRLLYWRMR